MTGPRVTVEELLGAADWLRSYEGPDGVIGDHGAGGDERAEELLRVAGWLDAEIARRQEGCCCPSDRPPVRPVGRGRPGRLPPAHGRDGRCLMATRRKPAPLKVRRATAYRRLAQKAWRANNLRDYDRFTGIADRLMSEHRREVAARAARAAADAAWRARA